MILGYINTKGRYASPSEQEQSVRSYADCYNLTIDKFLKTDDLAKTLPCNLKQGDVLIVADISIIGERFEDIIKVISQLSTYKLRICTIKENLTLDLGFPFLMEDCLNDVLKIYKGLLSIKNKAIQENLLQTGKKRGRPFGKMIRTSLSGQEQAEAELISAGVTKAEIAKRFGIGRTTLYTFLKRCKERNIHA